MNVTELQTIDQWNDITSQGSASPCGMLVFKFSPRCPISRSIEREFDAWCLALPDDTGVICVKIDVVNSRPLSQHIASHFSIRHESPQALWIRPDQQVQWHASHYSVSKNALNTQLQVYST